MHRTIYQIKWNQIIWQTQFCHALPTCFQQQQQQHLKITPKPTANNRILSHKNFTSQKTDNIHCRANLSMNVSTWSSAIAIRLCISGHYLAVTQKQCKTGTQLLWNANRNSNSLECTLSNDAISSDLDWPLTTPNHPISVTSRHGTKTAEKIKLVFGTKASLWGSAHPTLCWKRIRVSPFRTFTQTLELENFATARRSYQVLST